MMMSTRQFATIGLVALTIAGTAVATASQAEARNNFGRGFAAGLAGAVVGGALLAGATHARADGPPAYVPAPDTYDRGPVASYYPACHVVWRQDG